MNMTSVNLRLKVGHSDLCVFLYIIRVPLGTCTCKNRFAEDSNEDHVL